MIDGERPRCALAQARPLAPQLGERPNGGTQTAKTTGLAHCGGQGHLVPGPKRRADHGHVDAQNIAQSCMHMRIPHLRWMASIVGHKRRTVTVEQP